MRVGKPLILVFYFSFLVFNGFSQKNLPTDYLSKEFHKGRREGGRALMPDNAVMVVFAAPPRTFSNDAEYVYHQNPDLYYFTGYLEPNAVLLIFKNAQTATDGHSFTELFFVQKRDALREQWTGRRLGTQGVKDRLGISDVFEGTAFSTYPISYKSFSKILFSLPTGLKEVADDNGSLTDLVKTFREKASINATYNEALEDDLLRFEQRGMISFATLHENIKRKSEQEAYHANALIADILSIKDTNAVKAVQEKIRSYISAQRLSSNLFKKITGQLREIKTEEELALLRRAIDISCVGHNEAIKAIRPGMSEREIQGIQEFVHKKYGAEKVGYSSIVGSGDNGCILHYIENARTQVGIDMLVMDIGAEYHGYTADVTRSVPANGKFSAEQKAIYQLVYDAQEAAFKILKEGTTWAAASKAARDVIATGLLKLGIIKTKDEVNKYYPHGLSHHIGLDVHDRGSTDTLRKGMVITIEPGIYIASGSPCDKKWWGIGVRIEDNVLIRKDDFELLTTLSPRSIEGVEKLMAQKSRLDNFILPQLPAAKKAF